MLHGKRRDQLAFAGTRNATMLLLSATSSVVLGGRPVDRGSRAPCNRSEKTRWSLLDNCHRARRGNTPAPGAPGLRPSGLPLVFPEAADGDPAGLGGEDLEIEADAFAV